MPFEEDPPDAVVVEVHALTRRDAVRWLGVTLASAPLATWLGCATDSMSSGAANDGAMDAEGTADGSASGDGASGSGTTGDAGQGDGAQLDGADGWASGGTAAMTALAAYPNPFSAVQDSTCIPTCAMVLGPCHDDQAPDREDISEGQAGLPLRFGLRILDEACQPVTDADVDIWHCDVRGVYSSETADSPAFCTGDDQVALAARWFRGHQATDGEGVAWFSTCFPGWYAGRAIHIHFTVRRAGRDGDEYLTSQLAFPAELVDALCGDHPDYAAHGLPDTSNTTDSIFEAGTVDEYVLDTERMTDGALLAWKTIILRSSLAESVCSVGGGMGMPPGGGTGIPPEG